MTRARDRESQAKLQQWAQEIRAQRQVVEEYRQKTIPEELISTKAHQIWKQRQKNGRAGTAESDWIEARQYLEKHWWVVIWWKFRRRLNKLGRIFRTLWRVLAFPFKLLWKFFAFPFWLIAEPLSRDFALEIVKTLGIGLTAFGLLFSVWEGLEDRRLTQEKLVTDRFSKSVEQLGKEKITVRIGGIYALERIANDSPKDFWTIMEVLTSYVRENSPLPPELNEQEIMQRQVELKKLEEVSIDVQAVLTVIGRREDPEPDRGEIIDLHFTNLKEANLWSAELQGADLRSANLQGALLGSAELQGVLLGSANLQGANLRSAELQGAYLMSAELQGADLRSANLQRAYLWSANLQKADLGSANLQGANLKSAELQGANLRSAELQGVLLGSANLQEADLLSANLQGADLRFANLQEAYLKNANLQEAHLKNANLTDAQYLEPHQIISTCFWEEAIHKGEWNWDEDNKKWLPKNEQAKQDNTNYIEELKRDKASNPKKEPDCSKWKK